MRLPRYSFIPEVTSDKLLYSDPSGWLDADLISYVKSHYFDSKSASAVTFIYDHRLTPPPCGFSRRTTTCSLRTSIIHFLSSLSSPTLLIPPSSTLHATLQSYHRRLPPVMDSLPRTTHQTRRIPHHSSGEAHSTTVRRLRASTASSHTTTTVARSPRRVRV